LQYDRDLIVRRIGELEDAVAARQTALDNTIGALVEVRAILAYMDRLEAAALTAACVSKPVEAAPIEAKE